MKKGYLCQVEKLIKDLTYIYTNNYPDNSSFIFSIITNIMENIELYEKNTQFLFAKSLVELGKSFSVKSTKNKNKEKDLHEEEMNQIINHFFTCILKLEKTVSDEHCKYLNELVEALVNNNYRIEIKKEIIDFSNNLGKFGQSYTNRRFSVYFCTILIRIGNNTKNDLYKRLLFLCEDTDRVVKLEIIYHIRYFIKECSPKFCKDNILPNINLYLEENELSFKSTCIESLLSFNNLDKFIEINNFADELIEKINEIITSDDYITLQNDFLVFESIFNNLLNISLKFENYRKLFINLIKKYLQIFFLKKKIKEIEGEGEGDSDCNTDEDYVTNYCEEKEKDVRSKLKIDYIIEKFPDILYIFNEEKDIEFINELMKEGTKVFLKDENKDIFYKKYHLMINKIPLGSYNLSKSFLDKIFYFLKDNIEPHAIKNYYIYNPKNKNNSNNSFSNNNSLKDINSPLLSTQKKSSNSNKNIFFFNFNNENTINSNKNIEFKESYLNEINNIFKEMLLIKNDEFIIFILCKFDSYYQTMSHLKDWRIFIEMLKALGNLPKYFLFNNSKYNNFPEINQKIFGFCKSLLRNSLNVEIEQEITNLLSELMLYDSVCRDAIVDLMKETFLENKSYFRRRIYLLFCNSIFDKFSFKFIKSKSIYEDILEKLLKKDNVLVQSWIIKLFNNYNIYEREILSAVNDIQEEQKKSQNLDLLLNIEIKKYILNYNNSQKNIFIEYKSKNRFKSSEFNKIDNEDKIYKIEHDILVRKKKEESEANNNLITFENKTNNKHKIKNLICGIQLPFIDNKKNNAKPYFNNKSKKKSYGENLINGNYFNSQNNHPNLNSNSGGKILQKKSIMNNTKKNNANKEFNGTKLNINNKYYNKNSSKEKNIKSDYQNTLFSPYRGKNNKNL